MLNELLERYWNAAYAEGKEGRDHDTEDGMAQHTLTEINIEVQRMLAEAETQRPVFVFHHDDPMLKLVPDGTLVILQRNVLRSNAGVTGAEKAQLLERPS